MDFNALQAAAKKRRAAIDAEIANCRSWSSQAQVPNEQAIHFTLKCTYLDMKPGTRNFLQSHRVGELREMLQERGLSTEGTKAILVERLRTSLPFVRFEIDGREGLQRVVNVFLYFFRWDNTHLWSMKMPRRGNLPDGVVPLLNHLGLGSFEFSMKHQLKEHGKDLAEWDSRDFDAVYQSLYRRGWTLKDLCLLVDSNLEAPGPIRTAEGSASELLCQTGVFPGDPVEKSGSFSLNQLGLQAGDKMDVTYDFGDNHHFRIVVEKVEVSDTLISEYSFSKYPGDQLTRARFVGRGKCRMMRQYEPYPPNPEEYVTDESSSEAEGE